ncbi:MAG TPA: hypothetical protein VMT46_11860, partial [Anaerolineaceae bacterium]|nr:hypothetical protein [Anaerolineaceae bacterium]
SLAVLDFGQLQEDNGHGKLSGYSGGLGNYHSTASLLFFQNLPALGQISLHIWLVKAQYLTR